MGKVCVVKNCKTGRKSKTKVPEPTCPVSFFRPTSSLRLQRWSKSLGMELKKHDYICQYHFKETDIKMCDKIVIGNVVHLHYNRNKQLAQKDALPTIEHQFRNDIELNQQHGLDGQKPKHDQQQFEPEPDQQPSEQEQYVEYEYLHEPSEQEPLYVELESDQHPSEYEQVVELDPDEPLSEQEHQQEQLDEDVQFNRHQPTKITPIINIMREIKLPPYWFLVRGSNEIEFMRVDSTSDQIRNHIVLNENLSITVICSNGDRVNVDSKIHSVGDIFDYLKFVERWPLCVGAQMEPRRYSEQCKGVIFGNESYQSTRMRPRCKSCRTLRRNLQSRNSDVHRSSEIR